MSVIWIIYVSLSVFKWLPANSCNLDRLDRLLVIMSFWEFKYKLLRQNP